MTLPNDGAEARDRNLSASGALYAWRVLAETCAKGFAFDQLERLPKRLSMMKPQ
jgi:hypothetical protein